MKTYEINPFETGWIHLDGSTAKVVAYFRDGHSESMSLVDFITLSNKKRKQVIQIDCYTEEELGDEERKNLRV